MSGPEVAPAEAGVRVAMPRPMPARAGNDRVAVRRECSVPGATVGAWQTLGHSATASVRLFGGF